MLQKTPPAAPKAPLKIVLRMMIFPLVMALGYPIMFITAYFDPSPQDMNLTVISTTKKAEDIAHQIAVDGDGKLNVDTVATVDDGKNAVTGRATRAAYDPKTGDLYVASAGSVTATNAAKDVFQKVADQQKKSVTVTDLVPTEKNDPIGAGFMYMVMIAMISGYLSALMINMLGKHLGLWPQLALLGVLGAAAGTVVTTITYRIYQLYDHNIVQSGVIIAALFIVVGIVQLGVARLIGQISSIFGVAVWIILGVPSSGISVPQDMMYAFFRVMFRIHPLAGAGDLMHSNLYFHGQGIGNDIALLATWLVIGALLLWIGALRRPAAPAAAGSQTAADSAGDPAAAATASAAGSSPAPLTPAGSAPAAPVPAGSSPAPQSIVHAQPQH